MPRGSATVVSRIYSKQTIKILFALSGNQCAHPDCVNTIIEPATDKSSTIVTAQICHIHPLKPKGSRAKLGLTTQESNACENLILLCRNHHILVDGQHETYPAELLKEWKSVHESKMLQRSRVNWEEIPQELFSSPEFPQELVDQKIKDDVDILQKSQFYVEFDRIRFSESLANSVTSGQLSRGSNSLRASALAWCARFLSEQESNKAEQSLQLAKNLDSSQELDIAEAFIISNKGDKSAALRILADFGAPASWSAAFMIVAHHEGAEKAIDWLNQAGISNDDLNSDGKYFHLAQLLALARWDDTMEVMNTVGDQELKDTPALHHVRAITYLLNVVPNELRTVVRGQLPLNLKSFPLATDSVAINLRQKAHQDFIGAVRSAEKLNCPTAAKIADAYALWLELMDPENPEEGKRRLENELCRPQPSLRLVFLGLQFGIQIEPAKVDGEIERQTALHGGMTGDAAYARFALAFMQETQEGGASYIAQYFDMLSEFLDKKLMQFCQIEMLSNAGLPERANEILNQLLEEGLPDIEESRLRRIISEAEGNDPVAVRKAQYEQTHNLQDLYPLVEILESKQLWDELCIYGNIMFEITHDRVDAERFANALINAGKTEKLVTFLSSNDSLLTQSKTLRILYCLSYYYEGKLLEARSEIVKLSDDWDNPNYRSLHVNLQIALGDWNSLSAYIATEFQRKDRRNAQELLDAAHLAFYIGSRYAKELLFLAAEKGNDDANVLAAAYFLASNAGWENYPEVTEWLHKANVLSSDDGPLQRISLEEVLDKKPKWDNRVSETWRLYSSGQIPIFVAAKLLNKSLIDLTIFPALANQLENDPRHRGCVPVFSGKRQRISLELNKSIGLDVTAMLTLNHLNVLDTALCEFESVLIPHSTMFWLFEEKQKAAFHQPSRFKDAHQIRDLLVNNFLEHFTSSTIANSSLSDQVGDELAKLIAEAEVDRGDNRQRIIVRSSPVYRLSSLLQEEADLTAHESVMSSCLSVVDALKERGQLTAYEENRACAYLQLHEKPWPKQPEISDGAILYLDSLSITYFLHLGIIEKLKDAGFKPIASPITVFQSNELISYEKISGQVEDAIERLRNTINSGIESGKIQLCSRWNADDWGENRILEHPTTLITALAGDCDAIISDDRFVNQYENVDSHCKLVPIYSTLDVLEALTIAGHITHNDQLEYRTLLYQAGYIFIPVNEEELESHLSGSIVKDGNIVESVELRAIRENILYVRMSEWLQLPEEENWLHSTFKVFTRVLKSLWVSEVDIPTVIARSNWLVDQLDIRGWVHRYERARGDSITKIGRGNLIMSILAVTTNIPQEIKDAYWNWAENRILIPIKEQFPELFDWLINQYREEVSDFSSTDLSKVSTNGE